MKRKSRNRHVRTAPPQQQKQPQASPPPPPPPQEPVHVREELRGLVAHVMLSPEMTAAQSMSLMMDVTLKEAGIDMTTVADMLAEQAETAAGGDLTHVRRRLAVQVATLDRMFHHLFALASVGKNTPQSSERFMRLAFRAQAQSMRTSNMLDRLCREPRRPARRNEDRPPAATPAPEKKAEPRPVVVNARPSIASPPVLTPVPTSERGTMDSVLIGGDRRWHSMECGMVSE